MSTALTPVETPTTTTAVRAVGLLRPIANPADVVTAQNETRELVAQALEKDRDYGTIPGTDKPTLLKPGAERLLLGFGLAPRFRIVEQEVDHDRVVDYVKRKKVWRNAHPGDRTFAWSEEAGRSIGLYRFVVDCEVVHRETGVIIAACIGSCSTMESKYIDRPRDVENTVLKMAEKRAFIGATLLALGLSDQFTQDTEDLQANGVLDARGDAAADSATPAAPEPDAVCPKCKGKMWDNRGRKKNEKAPDFKCRDKSCDGVYWPGQWPPLPEADAADAAVTADTPFPFGPAKDKAVREQPLDVLRWAIEDGRRLGNQTEQWQEVCRAELERRTTSDADGIERDGARSRNNDDDLPF